MTTTENLPGVERRTITKAAAWSTPVIAAALAAPARASSGGSCAEVDLTPRFLTPISFDLQESIIAGLAGLKTTGLLAIALNPAVDALIAAIRIAGDLVFNAKITYPSALQIVNNGPTPLPEGCGVSGCLVWDTDLLRLEDTIIGKDVLQLNGSGADFSATTVSEVPVGGVVAEFKLQYIPLVLNLNTGSKHTQLDTVTATILSADSDATNNEAVSEVGLNVTVLQAVSAALQLVKNILGVPDLFIRIPILT